MTQIFDKIGDNEALLKFKGITVDDLLIDLKFAYKEKVDEISVGVSWMTKIETGYGGVGAEDARIKPGNAMRLMPIFLSPQYNEILYNDKIEKTQHELEHLGKQVSKVQIKNEVSDFIKRTQDAQKKKKDADKKKRKLEGKLNKKVEEAKTNSNHSAINHIATTAKGKVTKCENEDIYMD